MDIEGTVRLGLKQFLAFGFLFSHLDYEESLFKKQFRYFFPLLLESCKKSTFKVLFGNNSFFYLEKMLF